MKRCVTLTLPMAVFAIALGADAWAQTQSQPMSAAIVRLATPACASACPEAIALQGVVQPESHRRLQALMDGLQGRRLPVVINSPGGNVDAALAMGKAIRAAGLDVVVARVEPIDACRSDDAACDGAQRGRTPARALAVDRTICSSACTLILAGGVRRIVSAETRLGVHQMAQSERERVIERVIRRSGDNERAIVSERVISQRTRALDSPAEVANRGVPEHLAELGIGQGFTDLTLATPHSEIRVLSPAERLATGIVTHDADPLAVLGLQPR